MQCMIMNNSQIQPFEAQTIRNNPLDRVRVGQWFWIKNVTTWIPMEEVFNIDNYNLGDYKMFLCDKALHGRYLDWAPALLTAEDEIRAKSKL